MVMINAVLCQHADHDHNHDNVILLMTPTNNCNFSQVQ
jgi:hypothetical protein